jgi:hypothetical protein
MTVIIVPNIITACNASLHRTAFSPPLFNRHHFLKLCAELVLKLQKVSTKLVLTMDEYAMQTRKIIADVQYLLIPATVIPQNNAHNRLKCVSETMNETNETK